MFIFGRTILLNVDKIVYFAILNMHNYMVSCVLCFFYSLLLSEQTCNPPVKKCWFDSHYCTPYGKAFLHRGMNCLLTLKSSLGFQKHLCSRTCVSVFLTLITLSSPRAIKQCLGDQKAHQWLFIGKIRGPLVQ